MRIRLPGMEAKRQSAKVADFQQLNTLPILERSLARRLWKYGQRSEQAPHDLNDRR